MSEKDKTKVTQPKNIPKDGQVILAIMKEMGINDCDPKTIVQLTEFVYRYATSILEEARMYANNSKKKVLDIDDVRLALQLTNESSFVTPPPREVILECAYVKNYTPLQLVKPHCGLRLPPDRYCLSACNYSLRTKKPSKSYALSGINSGIKLATKQNVSYIKRTNPIGITKQTVTIPKPKVYSSNTGGIQVQKTVLKPKIQITQSMQLASDGASPMELESSLKRKRDNEEDGAM